MPFVHRTSETPSPIQLPRTVPCSWVPLLAVPAAATDAASLGEIPLARSVGGRPTGRVQVVA
jgi:hypothetical protein